MRSNRPRPVSHCKECAVKRTKKWQRENPEKHRALQQRSKEHQRDIRHKKCSRCQVAKPAGQFYRRRDGSGLSQNCIECAKARAREWRLKYPDRYDALAERNYKRRDRLRRSRQVALLGLPDRCAICGCKFLVLEKQTGPQFDHNHGTGEARGWLCGGCNMGLGAFRDNPALLRQAATYLKVRGFHNAKPRIA